jgi:hypothetical protein
MLKKVYSGGQTGADQAGLVTAKKYGIETGGWIPKGWKTLVGPKPEFAKLYNIQEHSSPSYKPRTYANVQDSSGTIRLAYDFTTAGEICTLNAINKYKKPHISVDLINPIDHQEVIDWINENNIEILNVAGNSEKSCMGTYDETVAYLSVLFDKLGFKVTNNG